MKTALLMPPDDPVPRILTRFQAAQADHQNWRSLWQECYDLTLPEAASFYGARAPSARKRDHLYDGTAPDAVDQLAAALLAQLTPAWVNWFHLSPGAGVEAELRGPLAARLLTSTAILQDQIDRSNLGTELHQCFLDLVVGGTCVLRVTDEPPGSPVAFQVEAIPLSHVMIGADDRDTPNHIYRRRDMTLDDLVSLPLNRVDDVEILREEMGDKDLEILEFCEPTRMGAQTGLILLNGSDGPRLLDSRNVSQSPYIVCRFAKTPGSCYGRSPVMKALPDIKTANKVVELVLKNASIAVTGIWQAEDDGVLNPANIQLVPGAIIPKAVGSAGLKPLEMPARFDVSQLVLSDLRARIRHALLVDRFAMIEDRRMTATEVMERSAEMSMLLSATYGRLQGELLTPLLTRLYNIVRERGLVADVEIDGQTVQLTHTGPLARAQMSAGLRPIRTWIEALAPLGQRATEIIQVDQYAAYLADLMGIPETLYKPSKNPLPSGGEGQGGEA